MGWRGEMAKMAAKDTGLKGPWFKTWSRLNKLKSIFSCFWFIALKPMRFTTRYLDIAANTCDNKYLQKQKRRYPLPFRCVQVPITIQETGDWRTYKLQLLSSETSMVHVSMREYPKMKISLKVWLKMCLYIPYIKHVLE